MKQFSFLGMVLAMAVLACNNPSSPAVNGVTTIPTTNAAKTLAATLSGCYEYNIGQDTIRLTLNIDSNLVSGSLFYDMYEKDKARGTLKGSIQDSIIETSYLFNAEGMDSESEVFFRFKNDSLYMGEGPQGFKDGKSVFLDRSKIQFKTAFRKINCP
jgi:hypothetical protein